MLVCLDSDFEIIAVYQLKTYRLSSWNIIWRVEAGEVSWKFFFRLMLKPLCIWEFFFFLIKSHLPFGLLVQYVFSKAVIIVFIVVFVTLVIKENHYHCCCWPEANLLIVLPAGLFLSLELSLFANSTTARVIFPWSRFSLWIGLIKYR